MTTFQVLMLIGVYYVGTGLWLVAAILYVNGRG